MVTPPEIQTRIDELGRVLDRNASFHRPRAKGDYWIAQLLMLVTLYRAKGRCCRNLSSCDSVW